VVFGVLYSKRLSVVDVKEFGKSRQELDRWAFAFDAILVSSTARQPPSCLISQVGILPKNGGRLPRFLQFI
jgi:hypothetical protein